MRLEQVTIVLVEDDPSSRQSLAMVLESEGARVVPTADAEEGIEAALSLAPDVVICDIDLPAMDGFYLVQRLREDEIRSGRSPAVAVAITGHADEAYRLRSIGEGFHHFVRKPVDPERLVARLADAVDARALG